MISVCVATFNGERHIAEQLNSICFSAQVDEIIVSDDGSTDRTLEVVAALADSRIRVVHGPGKGLIKNFESLLCLARGDYIFLSDQDDVWLPTKVGAMLQAMTNCDLVVSDCRVVDDNLQEIHSSFFRLNRSAPGFCRNLAHNGYLGCCLAFRRGLLGRVLPFPENVPMHDWWIGLNADLNGRVMFLDTPLLLYRRHGGNASSTSQRSHAPLWKRLGWRASLFKSLLTPRRCSEP